jgi:hypothetical protein
MHLRIQVSCEVLQMIKMRACCTRKRQDQSVAEVANETAKPKRSGLERPVALKQTWASPARLLGSSPRKRGPITTVFGYGSWLSARFAGVGRDDDL